MGQKDPNPFSNPIPDAREIEVRVGPNLSFEPREFTAAPGEAIKLTLTNPDVVPHNWVLLKPGSLQEVGEAANAFIADPTAAAKQYVPANENILAYTDIVQPNKSETIYFTMPQTEGVHPFACTFPGHWMVMNGLLTLPQLPKR
jgi:azurin